MEHAPRAARGGGAAVVLTLLIALVEAVEAAADWHRAQASRAQAKAASEAAVLLREAAGLTGTPPPATKPRTARTARTARTPGRGLPAAAPVTGVPALPPRAQRARGHLGAAWRRRAATDWTAYLQARQSALTDGPAHQGH